MLKNKNIKIGFIGLVLPFFWSCQKMKDFKTADTSSKSDGYYVKSYLKQDALTKIALQAPSVIVNPINIYANKNFLFVGEDAAGIHIFSNPNAAKPTQIGFISVPALKNFSVANGFIICDNGNDLVSYRISGLDSLNFSAGNNGALINDPAQFGEAARKKNFFVYANYPFEKGVYFECPDTLGLVTAWEKRTNNGKLNCYR